MGREKLFVSPTAPSCRACRTANKISPCVISGERAAEAMKAQHCILATGCAAKLERVGAHCSEAHHSTFRTIATPLRLAREQSTRAHRGAVNQFNAGFLANTQESDHLDKSACVPDTVITTYVSPASRFHRRAVAWSTDDKHYDPDHCRFAAAELQGGDPNLGVNCRYRHSLRSSTTPKPGICDCELRPPHVERSRFRPSKAQEECAGFCQRFASFRSVVNSRSVIGQR